MTMTSPFGPRWGDLHGGIDFAAAVGTPVRSPENAKVIRVDRDDRAGLYVVLSPEGFPDLNLSFCHLSRTDMKEGDSLKAGETFALSGATGRITGPHLHIGAWIDGGIIDPGRYLKMAEWF
ncbi:MAG: hypothetical protein DCF25_16515 [Leptolyngbya foveolarum]|uniref:M23ase beta-sheet core domain-containing protein n=1 Tax=Leptolyngbya foveolarum TaxID=47253 RepID=A0A2W4W252_9CYAN|nr:MAG: hypothetical protein DCF25_16515 [Leptolyngbya foveolarum]